MTKPNIFNIVTDGLAIPPAEMARRLEVSDGHVWDLKKGRRPLTIKMAAKLEKVLDRDDIVARVVEQQTAA